MSQLCVNGDWSGSTLTWTRGPALDAQGSAQADRFMSLYEEGNLKAQGGDLPKALALFQRGLSELSTVTDPDPHLRVAEAALLWGLGTALDRTDRDEGGWRALTGILGPHQRREQLPLGLAINWSHSATLAGYRHDRYLEVCALLDGLQRLGWGTELEGSREAAEAVRERYAMLASFRARCFEGLMQEERFEEAAQVAERALLTQRQCDPQDEATLSLWTALQEAATRRQKGFRLPVQASEHAEVQATPEQGQPPAVRILWDGQGKVEWRLGELPEDPHNSALVRLYAEAAEAADRGDVREALALYDKGLAAWEELRHPRSSDALVHAMMLWGKGCLLDRQAERGSPEAWETLMKLAQPGPGNALPLPLLMSWTGSAVIVATNLGRWNEAQALLVMLMQMAMHPQLGGRDAQLSSLLVHRFLGLLEGVYGALESEPEVAVSWIRALQRKVEPEGLILLPLREILYHSLSATGSHREAEAVAAEVLAWAHQEGDSAAAQVWETRVKAAQATD